jgi:predicted ATP-dependent endonuclease of OLD family
MQLDQVIIENFRSYKNRITIDINDLTVFVGKNDIGKSTILEALDIFFNEGKGLIKIDKDDVNKQAALEGNTDVIIGAVFSGFSSPLTIDTTNQTTLSAEYLLNKDGKLEIIKKFPNAGKEKVFIKANHPTNPKCSDLLLKKIADLKKLLTDEISCDDKTRSAIIRRAIWDHYSDNLDLQEIEIELGKLDEKNIWDQLKTYLPLYALFQSDRKNSDGDNEIQDPMKLAVQEILKDQNLSDSLNQVAQKVEEKLKEVAGNTLEKLKEMNPDIANHLTPVIPSPGSLKWADVFKNVSITGDDEIPINKRGSGIKRLILLNFFRAEAERRRNESAATADMIYAIEEPETSQHPSHQSQLIEAFKTLAQSNNTQIMLTTHSPAIVKLLDFEHLKLIQKNPDKEVVNVEKNNLPYPSLNEVNFVAFNEVNDEYHNELYGYIESEGRLSDYKIGKSSISYIKIRQNGTTATEQKILSEYIRHQIHHPENPHNTRFTKVELHQSITEMRQFIQAQMGLNTI